MHAWSEEPFDNDEAAGWLYELELQRDVEFVRGALESAATANGHLDAADGAVAVAAAEIVAMSFGDAGPVVVPTVDSWVRQHGDEVGPQEVDLALAALDRVESDGSELAEHWEDAGDSWRAAIGNLRGRLALTA